MMTAMMTMTMALFTKETSFFRQVSSCSSSVLIKIMMAVGTFSSVTSPGENTNGTEPHDQPHDHLHDQPHDQLHDQPHDQPDVQDPPGRGFPVCPLWPDAIAGESSYADLSSKLSEKGSRMKMDFMTKMMVN